ncbi:unnamed protein product [Brassica rapa]|uniref:Uncharacterized protein n=1 Tax=Brassica campestris TaxID=3711 RepID=A0A3P6CAR9_BRACM|nr:unnamed protein product [Brassica rapa]VDD06811.1 unnamed protein product [Brassica rapa]
MILTTPLDKPKSRHIILEYLISSRSSFNTDFFATSSIVTKRILLHLWSDLAAPGGFLTLQAAPGCFLMLNAVPGRFRLLHYIPKCT